MVVPDMDPQCRIARVPHLRPILFEIAACRALYLELPCTAGSGTQSSSRESMASQERSKRRRRKDRGDPANNNKDDRDEEIKMLMARIAKLEAPQPSSQSSGFITPRENKHTTEDLIDLNSPPADQATEISHSHYHPPMFEPPPGLHGRVTLPTLIFTLMDFVAPEIPPEGSLSSSSSSSLSSSPLSNHRRKRERKNKKKAKKARDRSSSSRDSTHVKLKNTAENMITPKIKEPDTIKIKDLPEVHAFELWKIHIRGKIDSAAGGNDEAFEWIMAVEGASISYENLGKQVSLPIDRCNPDGVEGPHREDPRYE